MGFHISNIMVSFVWDICCNIMLRKELIHKIIYYLCIQILVCLTRTFQHHGHIIIVFNQNPPALRFNENRRCASGGVSVQRACKPWHGSESSTAVGTQLALGCEKTSQAKTKLHVGLTASPAIQSPFASVQSKPLTKGFVERMLSNWPFISNYNQNSQELSSKSTNEL